MAAIRNDSTTAGPAFGTASTIVKKIPVPIVAPTPIMVSGNKPSERPRAWAWPSSSLCSDVLVRMSFWPSVSFTTFFLLARVALLSIQSPRL